MADRGQLATRFRYFESLFKGDFEEGKAITLKREDVSSIDALRFLIDFDRSNYCDDSHDMEGFLEAANFLQLNPSDFQDFFYELYASPREMLSMFKTLDRIGKANDIDLHFALDTILENLENLFFEKEWMDLHADHIHCILTYMEEKDEFKELKDERLIKALKVWVNYDFENRKVLLPEFIPYMKDGKYANVSRD